MPSAYYTSNLIGFLASRPGRDEDDVRTPKRGETWEADLPLDDVHKEAMRLGLVVSAGRAQRSDSVNRGSRPFRLTEEGLLLRQSALDAKMKPGEDGPRLVDYRTPSAHAPASARDGFLAIALFGGLVLATLAVIWWLQS